MLQAPLFHGPPFDLFPFEQDGLAAPYINIGRGEIVQAFVVALMVVMADKRTDLRFEITW